MESFEEIYSLYFKDIYRYVLSLCRNSEQAEEITQETFFQAMKSISSFRGDCKMTVWLCQIADHLPDTTSQPLELRIADETDAMRILEYLHDIEEPYKEVFMLRVFGELSFKKISGIFGKTESWARVTYHRAKVKILNEMEGKQ